MRLAPSPRDFFRELSDTLGKNSFVTVWPQGYAYQWGICSADWRIVGSENGKSVHSVDNVTFHGTVGRIASTIFIRCYCQTSCPPRRSLSGLASFTSVASVSVSSCNVVFGQSRWNSPVSSKRSNASERRSPIRDRFFQRGGVPDFRLAGLTAHRHVSPLPRLVCSGGNRGRPSEALAVASAGAARSENKSLDAVETHVKVAPRAICDGTKR